jgi:hypothetical protein
VEAVDVLVGVDRAEDLRLVHVLGERKLDEDAVDAVVGVQVGNEVEDLRLGRVDRETVVARLDTRLVRCLVLRPHVDVRCGVVAHEYRREADGPPECTNVACDLCADLLRERLPVDAHR